VETSKTSNNIVLPEHLGGHCGITHIDVAILEYFKSKGASTYLDIGCGPGGMLDKALELGYSAQGVDGDFTIPRNNPDKVIIHDYTVGPLKLDTNYDLIWSCEFVEHVEEKYLHNFMETFSLGKTVCMTYAPVGTSGHHHVNCNTEEYWINVFNKYGFTYNVRLTKELRKLSSMKKKFFKRHGLVFQK